jgi:fucose permease
MAAFATNGALPASLLARYAEVKDGLGLDSAQFGLLVVGYAVGGTLALNLPGVVARRIGVARSAGWGTAWIALTLALVGAGVAWSNPWLVLAGLITAGLGDAIVDVAQNSQGIRVQTAYGRSLLNSMHAGWSIGAAIGGAVGTLAAVLGVPLWLHLLLWGALCATTMAASASAFLPETAQPGTDPDTPDDSSPEPAETPRLRRSTMLVLLPLALIALAGISVEDIGNNWSAVLLASERDMALASAGIGLTVLLTAQFVGRLFGDAVIDVLGDRRALYISLAAVILGLTGAAWAPNVALTLVGLAVAGAGSAITVPLAFAKADAVPGLAAHSGVTWISWTMRTVTIGLSPAIGALSSVFSLPLAITTIVLIAVAALMLQVLRRS